MKDEYEQLSPVAEFPWRPRAKRVPQNEPEIECPNVNELPLRDVFAASHIHTAHGTAETDNRERLDAPSGTSSSDAACRLGGYSAITVLNGRM